MNFRDIETEVQAVAVLCVTVVLLALIAWGCEANHQSEITRRIIATNTVLKGGQ